MTRAKFSIVYFSAQRGTSPVLIFVENLEISTQAKLARILDLVSIYGHKVGMPYVKSLKNGIYELRIRGKEEVRIFFCYKNSRIYLLHAIIKKKMKIPAKDIKIALDRMNNL